MTFSSRLLEQVGIDVGHQRRGGHVADQGHVAGGELLGGQRQHVADHRAQVLLAQLQFDRAGEVHQHLHHAVEAVNLRVDDLQVPHRRGAGLAQLGLQQFQVNHDGVDGVLHLVAHAGGEPADGRHAPRELQLRLDLLRRLQIVQGDQRAQSLAGVVVVDEIQRGLNAPAGLGANLFLRKGGAGVEGFAQSLAQHRGAIENLARVQAQNALLGAQKAPRGL